MLNISRDWAFGATEFEAQEGGKFEQISIEG